MLPYSLKEWFVIKVFCHRELFLKEFIEKHCYQPVNIIIFSKEFYHNYQGKTIKLIKPLFPGYLFVQKNLQAVLEIVKTRLRNELFSPIHTEGKALKVNEDEIKLLLLNSDENGIFRMSQCYVQGNGIKITEGPLKNIEGKIQWINKRKKRAQVEISLFKRKMIINLGVDFIAHEENSYT